jgi:hypothetical protein
MIVGAQAMVHGIKQLYRGKLTRVAVKTVALKRRQIVGLDTHGGRFYQHDTVYAVATIIRAYVLATIPPLYFGEQPVVGKQSVAQATRF